MNKILLILIIANVLCFSIGMCIVKHNEYENNRKMIERAMELFENWYVPGYGSIKNPTENITWLNESGFTNESNMINPWWIKEDWINVSIGKP